MLVNFKEILKDAKEKGYAVPAFNVYNMETTMGIIKAAEEMKSPVIMQFYSRLATTGVADYLAPVMLKAAEKATVPVCLHLDHGTGYDAAAIAVKNGVTGVMLDFSKLSMEENIEKTKKAVEVLSISGIGVEGEIGHIGTTAEELSTDYTTVEEAKKFVEETGVGLNQYLVNCRLYAAKHLLISTNLPVNQIAVQTGFKSNVYFNNFFTKKMNISPKKFRNQREKQIDVGVFKI